MKCKNCGASMTPIPDRGYFFCEYCGSYGFPEANTDGVVTLEEQGKIDCPICAERLIRASVEGNPVLYCNTCRGILAEQEIFSDIVKCLRAQASGAPTKPRSLPREELQRKVRCPCCDQLMDTHPYYGPGNVVVDNCMRCALVWLDYGELNIIANAPGRDRDQASSLQRIIELTQNRD